MAKLKALKLEVSPEIYLLLIVLFGLGKWEIGLSYIAGVSLHEAAHLFTAMKLGYTCKKLKVTVFGACLYGDFEIMSTKDEVLTALVAPLSNLTVSAFCVALWWVYPESYHSTYDFVLANMALGISNLLPCYPLDGGRVFAAVAGHSKSRQSALKSAKHLNLIFGGMAFCAFLVTVIFGETNFSLGLCGLFIVSGGFGEIKGSCYAMTMASDLIEMRLSHGIEVKSIAMSERMTYFEAYKICSKNKLYRIHVLEESYPHRERFVITSTDIEKGLLKASNESIGSFYD